ncbi:MAG: GNAT family N-acetyltransferase [Alphaproteobacteria bacterium]
MNKILKLLKVSLIINVVSLLSASGDQHDEEPKTLTVHAPLAAVAGAAAASSTTEVITYDQIRGLLEGRAEEIRKIFKGDAVAILELYKLIPVYKAEHNSFYKKMAEESKAGEHYSFQFYEVANADPLSVVLCPKAAFLVYKNEEPVGHARIFWNTEQQAFECCTYVVAACRSQGIGTIAKKLLCQYIDQLRSIKGLEIASLIAECSPDNIAVLRANFKAGMRSFDISEGFVFYAYPARKMNPEYEGILLGIDHESPEIRGKARYELYAREKADYLRRVPVSKQAHVHTLFDALMALYHDASSGKFTDVGAPQRCEEKLKSRELQEAKQALKDTD